MSPILYSVTVSSSPNTDGSVTGGGTFLKFQSAMISETPNTGYSFINWTCSGTGCYSGTSASASFKVVSNDIETANFQPIQYTLQVTPSPAGEGAVTGGGTYAYGSS
ncbi:hypothetical protein B1B_08841, partial [mine drainage metagenome]